MKKSRIVGTLEGTIMNKSDIIRSVDTGYRLCKLASFNWSIEGVLDIVYVSAMSSEKEIVFGQSQLSRTIAGKFPEELLKLVESHKNRQAICSYIGYCGLTFVDSQNKPELTKPSFQHIDEMCDWVSRGYLTIRNALNGVHSIELKNIGCMDSGKYSRAKLLRFPWLYNAMKKLSGEFRDLNEHLDDVDKIERQLETLHQHLTFLSQASFGFDNAAQNRVADVVQQALRIAANIGDDYDTKKEKLAELIGSFHTFTLPADKSDVGLLPLPQDEEDDNPYM